MSRSSSDSGEKPQEAVQTGNNANNAEKAEYPSNQKRIVIMLAVYLTLFLVNLDQNIISTAIPRITDEFKSIDDVSWYGTAYILTMCSFQLLMGKIYKFYPVKPVFISGVVLFEVGSAVCGAAPTSTAFIIGRAVAGLGGAGMFSGFMVIMFHVVPLSQRPIYQGMFGAVFAIASVIGPLLGGVFVDKVTWRWCFYINLPIGAVSILVTMLIMHVHNQKLDEQASGLLEKLKQLDPIGNLIFFPGVICLVLAFQWGGVVYPWNDARIIVLFVLCGVLIIAFIGVQAWKKEDASLPPRVVNNRSMLGAAWYGFFMGAGMMVLIYYLPIWFQAVKGVSAFTSGLMLLPIILSAVVGSLVCGVLITKVGYYTPFFYIATVLASIGTGLMTTFTPDTGSGKWIGYQILAGIGFGCGSTMPLNVAQTVLDRPDIAAGSAFIMFSRFIGSAIFLPVAQTVLLSSLVKNVSNLPNIDPKAVAQGGITELTGQASGQELDMLIDDYSRAIIDVFYMAVAVVAITIFGCFFVEWRSLKSRAAEQEGKKESSNSAETTKAQESV
ncbi:major facilitator superfamily domain-containing protein [Hypoxylon sp. FL1284]|nr:major facilitator superfamily domain-containing protein [Hypoxylon sp. FL1284]